jgi:hypothetical protein
MRPGGRHHCPSKETNGMSNTERKKEIDDITDLLERAKAMIEEMRASDQSDLEAMQEENTEEDEEAEDTEEMQLLAAFIENLEAAADVIDDAVDYVIKAVE